MKLYLSNKPWGDPERIPDPEYVEGLNRRAEALVQAGYIQVSQRALCWNLYLLRKTVEAAEKARMDVEKSESQLFDARIEQIEENLLVVERNLTGLAYFVARDELLGELIEIGDRMEVFDVLGGAQIQKGGVG